MTYVVPNFSLDIIRSYCQSPLEAAEGHIQMLGIEAAQSHVGEDLCCMHSHLKETPGKCMNEKKNQSVIKRMATFYTSNRVAISSTILHVLI